MTRRAKAAALSLIDVVGPQKKKARCLSAWVRQAIPAVVSIPYKTTGASALTLAPAITSTSPRARTHSKSLRSPGI